MTLQMIVDDYRCYRAARCADWGPDGNGGRLGARINASHGLCPTCTRHATSAIEELRGDYETLSNLIGMSRPGMGDKVSSSRDLPVPVNLAVEALRAEMVFETACWATSVAHTSRIQWGARSLRSIRPEVRLARAARLLSRSVPVLLALRGVVHAVWSDGRRVPMERDGLDGALLLLDLHYRAKAVAGLRRLVHRLPAPCSYCQRLALERPDGSDTIRCAGCGSCWTWEEYEQRCTLLVAELGL